MHYAAQCLYRTLAVSPVAKFLVQRGKQWLPAPARQQPAPRKLIRRAVPELPLRHATKRLLVLLLLQSRVRIVERIPRRLVPRVSVPLLRAIWIHQLTGRPAVLLLPMMTVVSPVMLPRPNGLLRPKADLAWPVSVLPTALVQMFAQRQLLTLV